MKWFLGRMSEGTTWAGLAAILPSIIQVMASGRVTAEGVAAVAGGLAAVLIKEKGGADAGRAG